ncbi:MAG: hypothetical protein MK110_01680 [Fuerstiella sp.]|nr:hypothetical protein [Fuerstiella sp.]
MINAFGKADPLWGIPEQFYESHQKWCVRSQVEILMDLLGHCGSQSRTVICAAVGEREQHTLRQRTRKGSTIDMVEPRRIVLAKTDAQENR